jgi:hypothetical protein
MPAAGLCNSCRDARIVRSDRGALFLRCGRADREAGFPKYPVLPVLVCRGFNRTAPE